MVFKMKGWSPFTKNGKTDINAKVINTQEEIDAINKAHDDYVVANKEKLLKDSDPIPGLDYEVDEADRLDLDKQKERWKRIK